MLLLTILGSVTDVKVAAELALHMWYSVCIPVEYKNAAALLATQLFEGMEHDHRFRKSFGRYSSISGKVSEAVIGAFATTMINRNFNICDAAREYDRVRYN